MDKYKKGQIVHFKNDIEQLGVVEATAGEWLTLSSYYEEGFQGDYIGGRKITVIHINECWTE